MNNSFYTNFFEPRTSILRNFPKYMIFMNIDSFEYKPNLRVQPMTGDGATEYP